MAGRSASEPAVSVDPDSALMITYTSGTTGTPKGVLSSHRATLNNYLGMVVEGDLQPTDITLVNLPLFHTGGMHALLQPTLFRGGTAVIMAGQFDPDRVLDAVSRHRVTLTMWVPTMLAMLTQHPNAAAYDVRTLTKIWYGVIGDHSYGAGSGHGVVQVPVLSMVRTGGDRHGVGTPS